MPYKSEKINIENTKYDRRCKLTDEQKNKIVELRGQISQRKCAEMFGVSRRTIVFLWYPERLERNIQARQQRGGWKKYYTTDKQREYIKDHRRYKQDLYVKGLIKDDLNKK